MTNTSNIIEFSPSAGEAIPPPPPLSIDSGSADGLNNDAAATFGNSPRQWAKKNKITIAFAALLVGVVTFAAVAFRPGGPGRVDSNIQASLGIALEGPTYMPTYMPTYVPTYLPTSMPTEVPTEVPTSTPTSKPTKKPTPPPVEEIVATPFPTTPSPTMSPTLEATDQATVTVSTEVTGPPTAAGRDPVM